MAALYQRARPATFAEVVGQEHVKDVLLAALRGGNTSHAYLFSGPRGVGKTTTARLLAMALNCEAEGEDARPCGGCEGCRMVREGHHPDVIELDAASNNSVDDVRDLREKTSLASMRGGSRVWILDEAHMLSKAAANALLKTLEEPPPGLVFVLATTEPEKLPPTVLSRCQHFRFRRHTEAEIVGKLERLCKEAGEGGVEAEPEALALLARAADGAMRDAESLLERLLTPGAKISLAAAEDALGLPPVHRMQHLATALASGNLEGLLSEAEALYRDGFAPRSLAENLGTVLRDALRAEVVGVEAEEAFRLPVERAALLRLIHALDDEQERFIRRDDLYSLEVALLKGHNVISGNLAASPGDAAPAETKLNGNGKAAAARASQQDTRAVSTSDGRAVAESEDPMAPASEDQGVPSTEVDADLPSFEPTGRGPAVTAQGQPAGGSGKAKPKRTAAADAEKAGTGRATDRNSGPSRKLDWHAVRSAAGPQLKAFLMPARESVDGEEVVIRFSETHKFHYTELKKRESELASLIEEVAGPGYRLSIEGPGGESTKKS